MRKLIILLFITFICPVFIAGCTSGGQRTAVEELALVSSVAFDYVNDKEMRVTVSIPQPAGESPVLTEVYSVNTEMIQEGLVEISSQTDNMLVLNQLRTILFSEEFAKSGKITDVVEHFYRDSTIGNKIRLVVVKDKAEDILKSDYPENQHLDAYLNDLFQPSLHNSFSPFTTIHDYMNTQKNPVYHSMIPYLEKKEKSLKVTSIALFNEVKMIQTITTQQSLFIQALKGLEKLSPIALGVVNPYIDTNVDNRTILTIGKGLLSGKVQGMETMRIPVENSFDEKRINRVGEVLSIDFEKNKQALQEFLSPENEVDSKQKVKVNP